MPARTPPGAAVPPGVQRLRLRYAKRGRLSFCSQRDVARVLERAVRRAGVPVAFSAGFTAHPKISYAPGVPTGVASEAEYADLVLSETREPAAVGAALDAALPDGLDVLACVQVPPGGPSLAEVLRFARWRLELPGVTSAAARQAATALQARAELVVLRATRAGPKSVDIAAGLVGAWVSAPCRPAGSAMPPGVGGAPVSGGRAGGAPRAILEIVVRQTTPTVRPDDVLVALRDVAGVELSGPLVAVRLSQGPACIGGEVADPLAAGSGGSTARTP